MVCPRDSTGGPPRCSGEKSAATGKTPSVGEKRGGMRSEYPRVSSSAPLSPDAQARHDALVAAKALMQFPPNDGDPKIYQEWRAHVEALLDYADGGPRPDPTRAPTVDGPVTAGGPTRSPWTHPHGERQAETAPPAPLRAAPPMANRLNRDGGKAISVGSSTTHDQDLRRDLDNRQTEDMGTHVGRRRERHRREGRDDDIGEGCLALAPEFRGVKWPDRKSVV